MSLVVASAARVPRVKGAEGRCCRPRAQRRQKEREEGGVDYYSASGLRRLPTNYLSTRKSPAMQPKQAGRRDGEMESKPTVWTSGLKKKVQKRERERKKTQPSASFWMTITFLIFDSIKRRSRCKGILLLDACGWLAQLRSFFLSFSYWSGGPTFWGKKSKTASDEAQGLRGVHLRLD